MYILDIINFTLFIAIGYVAMDVLSKAVYRYNMRKRIKDEALNDPDPIGRSIASRIYVRMMAGQDFGDAIRGSSAVIQSQLDQGLLPVEFHLEEKDRPT